MTPPTTDKCSHLLHPNVYTVLLASIILLGILISYLPQHYKIINRRSSEGLSPWWVLLGGLSSIAAIGNILTLPSSRADVGCCKKISGGECAAALLGIAQIGLQWACFMFIVMLFLIFFPTEPELDLTASTASLAASLTKSPPPKRRDAIIVGITTLLSLLLVGLISLAITSAFPHHTQNWANTLGTIAGTLAMIQYVPQIYFTWRLGDVKSLSVVTMVIQVPGAFLFAFSLWLRVGWEGWSTWLVYLVTGVLQACLLALAVKYYFDARRARAEAEANEAHEESDEADLDEGDHGTANERTGLLSNGHSSKSRPMGRSTQRSNAGQRSLSMLYAATPPDQDSEPSETSRR